MNSFGKWIFLKTEIAWEFPGSAMVKTQCFHCWDKGSIPDQATKIQQVMQGNQKKKKKNLAKVFCKGSVQFCILACSVWKFQLPVISSSSTWYHQGFEFFFPLAILKSVQWLAWWFYLAFPLRLMIISTLSCVCNSNIFWGVVSVQILCPFSWVYFSLYFEHYLYSLDTSSLSDM